jgi:rubrerythrin
MAKVLFNTIKKFYFICADCAKENGGTFPEGHVCTVSHDKCPVCQKETTVIPYVDFDWEIEDTSHLRD